MSAPLRVEIEGPVARLTLDRPEVLNAIDGAMCDALADAFDALEADESVRAVVIAGAGPSAFSAGADLKYMRSLEGAALRRFIERTWVVFERVAASPLPSVCALHGHVLGGGLELALACTFRVASPRAKMGLPEIKLGLIPGYGGTQRLPRLVGEARALDMVLTGRTVGAEEALAIGLVNRLAEGDVLDTAKALAAEFSGYGLPALAFARDAIKRALDTPLHEGLRIEADLSTLAFRTADAVEGLTAFVEKRKPQFQDR